MELLRDGNIDGMDQMKLPVSAHSSRGFTDNLLLETMSLFILCGFLGERAETNLSSKEIVASWLRLSCRPPRESGIIGAIYITHHVIIHLDPGIWILGLKWDKALQFNLFFPINSVRDGIIIAFYAKDSINLSLT